jgi:hypothetical protein
MNHGQSVWFLASREDARFPKLLAGVWRLRMSEEVWARFQTVSDHKGWGELGG